MTAADARKLTDEARQVDEINVGLILRRWHEAIGKAARRGDELVREVDVEAPALRTSRHEWAAAVNRLREEGYAVHRDAFSGELEVSW